MKGFVQDMLEALRGARDVLAATEMHGATVAKLDAAIRLGTELMEREIVAHVLTPNEAEAAAAFVKEHDDAWMAKSGHKYGHPYYGAIGGGYAYVLSPNNIGTGIKIRHTTGAEKDITDYDSW